MARTKGKGRPKSLALQPLRRGKLNQRKRLHEGDQRTPRLNQKSLALQPKKTQEFKQLLMHRLEPHPSSRPLLVSDLKSENPCMDIVLAAGDTVGNRPEASVGMQPMSYLPPCLTTPSYHSIVPHETPLSSRTVSICKTKSRRTSSYYLNRKKLAALSNHFNPIPFVREKPSNFANYRVLLARLGLWNFLHLDFGHNIHSDLIKQLIVHYNPKKPANRRSHVNGCPILVSRATLACALSVPSKRLNLDGSDAARTGPLVVSEEEAAFLEELVSSWLVLQDDGCELPGEVSKVKFLIREKRLEDVDWAGLIWFMVRSELLEGAKLVNCHYASHMQLLLKNQKPRLFVDHIDIAGFLSTEAALCDGANLDYSLSASGEPEIVKGWEKQRILDVGDNAVGVEESSSERKTESTQEMCSKWRNSSPVQCEEGSTSYQRKGTDDLVAVNVDGCKGNKLQEPQHTLTISPGDIEGELDFTTRLIRDHNVVGEVSDEKFSNAYQQSDLQKEDGNDKLKLLSVGSKDDEIKWTAEDLFVGNSGELPDSLEMKLTVDFKCNKKKQCQSKLADLEFGSSNDMLMNEHCCDKKLKMEYSGDFTASGMHVLSKLESQFEQMDLDSGHDNGEKEFVLDDLVENCRTISDKLCTSNELPVLKMKSGNKELRLLPDEDKRKLSHELASAVLHAAKVKDKNPEVLLLHHVDARELPEGLGKEEIFDRRTGDLIDSQEKEEVNNDSECRQMDYNQQQLACLQERDGKFLESVSANNMLMNEESIEERLKVDFSSNLSVSGMLSHGRLETNFRQMDLIFGKDSCRAKYGPNVLMEDENTINIETFNSDDQHVILTADGNRKDLQYGLNVLMEDQNTIDIENFTSDDQHAIETADGNRKVLQNELPEGSDKNEQFDGKIGKLLESQEKKVGNSTEHDTKIGDGDYEKEFSDGPVKEELLDARVGDSHDSQEMKVCFIAEKSTMDSKNQHTKIAMEDNEKPEQLGTAKPETSGLNVILGNDMDLQNMNRFKCSSFVEPFAVQQEIRFTNFDYSPLDKSLKREIDCLNDRQFECQLNVTKSAADDESFDLDCCSKQAELWMSRLKNAAKMDKGKNAMLLKELETKNLMIQQSEKRRRQEQHRYQKDIYRLEREVYLMRNILDEYRTALNEVDKSFAEYRRRAQLPAEEEPIYVDHPDGGGKVVLATELMTSNLKQGRENL